MTSLLKLITAGCVLLAFIGCRQTEVTHERSLGFDEFIPQYNNYIEKWLTEQQTLARKEAERITAALATAEGEAKSLLEIQVEANNRELTKWEFRLGLGPYFKIGDPAEVPIDLAWQNGMDQPEIGDPRAKKGGVLRRDMNSFPPTIRPFGNNSNNSFRSKIYDEINMALVSAHSETMEPIPGLAKEWATSADGRTIYFRIDPTATYSDGVPVRARDFLVTVYVNVSDYVTNTFEKQYYRENIAQIAMYDDLTLSVSLPELKVFAPQQAGGLSPTPAHFYNEYGPDYAERYQWRFPPTTGAYEVKAEDIIKGVSITQTRVQNWWAKDRKYYRYRFNPDKLVHTVVRDEAKAFELFRAGELDTFLITRPELWYEKSEMPPVYDGFIERVTFYKRYPKLPLGFYLNVRKPPLDDRDVRIGIHYASNWQKVIEVMFRGDYQRLNAFHEGFGPFSDPSIQARPFSISQARASFQAAGYTEEGNDGILKKPDGTRLSISLTYPSEPDRDRMLSIIREDAKSCGLELRLDGLEFTVAYKKEMQKQHEMALSNWSISPPIPDFYQYFHSTNAIDEKGNPKPQTNNLFVWGRPDTDRLSEQVRNAQTKAEVAEAAWKLQNIIHDEGIFVPGYSVDFVRVGSWRWVKWPDSPNTRFSPPVVFEPHEAYVLWIDDDVKAETQTARRTGKTFPESARIVSDYRYVGSEAKKEEIKQP